MDQAAPRANRVLAMLLAAYVLNYLDRQMLGILAVPIKGDLHLSDTQFGAVGGLAFALLYSLLGVPLSYLADRTSRGGVVAASLAVWSAFTALCGTATGFVQLMAYRLGVGIGEAGGVAPSYALIADYFPPHRRARALGIYSLGVPLGLGFGTLLGAYLATWLSWRAAFFVMGAIGLILVPFFRWVVRDRPRSATARTVRPSDAFRIVARRPAFWLMAGAASCSSLAGYGLAVWVPSVMMRSYGLDLIHTAWFVASLLLIGGTSGVLLGGYLGDRFGREDRRAYAWLSAAAWAITAPLYAAGLLTDDLRLAWLLLLIPNALNILWLGPVVTAVQHLVAAPMRATASGCFLLINNLVGLGIGPLLIGILSDAFKARLGDEALRYAAVSVLGFYGLAMVLMLLAAPRLAAHWVEDDPFGA